MYCPVEEFPRDFEVCGEGEDYSVLTPLAMSDDGYRMVAVETRLLGYIADGDAEHEFKFCISVLDLETMEPFRIFDRDMSEGYLPTEVRGWVIPCVVEAAKALYAAVQPRVICRVTNATRPPDKALVKHQMITDTFVQLGLRVEDEGTDRFGRKYWRMRSDGENDGKG